MEHTQTNKDAAEEDQTTPFKTLEFEQPLYLTVNQAKQHRHAHTDTFKYRQLTQKQQKRKTRYNPWSPTLQTENQVSWGMLKWA